MLCCLAHITLPKFFFLSCFYYFKICTCVGYIHMHAVAHGGHKRVLDPWDGCELDAGVRNSTQVLGGGRTHPQLSAFPVYSYTIFK